MKIYVTLIIAVFAISACQNIQFGNKNHPYIQESIIKIKGSSKTLIVEFWAPSCGSCIRLKNDIFGNDQNSDFLNKNFVLVKVSPSDSIYKSLFKYYKLNFQSSVLFFNADGVEIERSVGYDRNKAAYMSFLKDIAKGENMYSDIYEEYIEDTTDVKYNYLLAQKLLLRYEKQKAYERFNYIFLKDEKDKFGYHSECAFRIAEYEFNKSGSIEKLKKYVNAYSSKEFVPQAYTYLINYYNKEEDHKSSVHASAEALTKFSFNPGLLNKHAWNIYLFKISEDYEEALEMVESAIEINPKVAGYWDTKAWLCFELGETSKAIRSEKKAIKLFPHQAYKEALKKFESF